MVADETQIRDAAPAPLQGACTQCALGQLCFPHVLPAAFRNLFPLVQEQRVQVGRGEFLFRAGDPVTGIYAVKAGFLKTCMPLPDGQSKIVGFHAMGDALGLDSLDRSVQATDAIALNGCEVCLIPLDKFEKLLEHPAESVHVRQLMARELARVEQQAATIGTLSAKQLVAIFLLDMSGRWEERGYSKSEFLLFMSRKEIGNYLGLTFETVSRTLSYFQDEQWIAVHGKHMLIRDMPALQSQLTRAT